MKINIYETPVSLAAFVVVNVCDNVRLHHLPECLYYRIQEEGTGMDVDSGYIRLVEGVTHIFCAC